MNLKVGPFKGTASEWDRFGEAQPGWTAFHRYAWRQVIERTYNHNCLFAEARNVGGKLEAILPLVEIRSRLFGHFLVSMPYVSYGGPLGNEPAIRAILEWADEMSRKRGADLVELRCGHPLHTDWPVSRRKIAVVLTLSPQGPEAVFASLKAKVRSQVRRPAREGISVTFGPDQLEPFHSVFSRHMRALGTPAIGIDWFRALRDAFKDDIWFACAWLNGKPVAGGAGFRWQDEFEITWASSLREFNKLSPNMALYWAFIERASYHGVARFNFGRCTAGSATHRFKTQWGAVDEDLYWYQAPGAKLAQTPTPEARGFSVATRIWARLPIALTNTLGPRLIRYLP